MRKLIVRNRDGANEIMNMMASSPGSPPVCGLPGKRDCINKWTHSQALPAEFSSREAPERVLNLTH